MKNLIKYFVVWLVLLQSCYSDVNEISIRGVVTDKETGNPIEGANVEIVCWKYGDTPDGSYTEEEVVKITSDAKGAYSWTFNKGAFIEVKANKDGYLECHEAVEVNSKVLNINLKLVEVL